MTNTRPILQFMTKTLMVLSLVLILYDKRAVADPVVRTFRHSDICGRYNNHRVYLELNEKGILQASNVTYNQTQQRLDGVMVAKDCNLELVTCPSCIIKIKFLTSGLRNYCYGDDDDHILVTEPPYDPLISGRRLCGRDSTQFRSQTRSVNIRFVYRNDYNHAFSLEYFADRNRFNVTSAPSETVHLSNLNNKSISTPFFPTYYPRDYAVEYEFRCTDPDCRIHIIFTDYQVSLSSAMEFYDWNGDKLDFVTGLIARPRPIMTTGPSMVIRFFANGGTGLGFKAEVRYLTDSAAVDPALRPVTDCGGLVESYGGAITMMKMVVNETEPKLFDCVWLIRPPSSYMHLKTHLMIRVETFERMAGVSELIIRQGITSDKPELQRITNPTKGFNGTSWIVPLTTGFYVSLKGVFGGQSRLAIIYAVYSYMNCFIGSEFLCANHRCIPIQLHCDGFDHCGDKSDEPESCSVEWETEMIDRRWYVHTPNYYFPKIDRYPDLKTATTIFVMSCIGLLTLISCLIILLYKTGARARDQRELQSQLQTISELLDNNNRVVEELEDDPPNYEAPPDYDDLMKMGLCQEISRPKRSSGRKSRLQRPQRSLMDNPVLEVVLPPETTTQTTTASTAPTPAEVDRNHNIAALRDQLENSNFFIASQRIEHTTVHRAPLAETSETNLSQSSITFPGGLIPESPPPAYSSGARSQSFFFEPTNSGPGTPASPSNYPQYQSESNLNNSGGTSCYNATTGVGFTDTGLNVALPGVSSLLESTHENHITSCLPSPPQPASTSLFGPTAHLWTDNSRNQKQWVVLRSTEGSPHLSHSSSLDSADLSRFKEINTYFLTYSGNVSSCPSCSSSSGSESASSSNVDSPSRLCSACGGKLSFRELPTNVTMVSQFVTTRTNNATTTTEVRLCNCIPTVHSTGTSVGNIGSSASAGQSAIQATSSTSALPIANRVDQLMTFHREVDVADPFKSHTGLAKQVDASLEAKLDTISRSESGF